MHLLKQLKYVGFGILGYATLIIFNLLAEYFLEEAFVEIAGSILLISCVYLLGRGLASLLGKD